MKYFNPPRTLADILFENSSWD